MDNKQDAGQQDCQFGMEILVSHVNGRCMLADNQDFLKIIHNLEDMTLTGKYMSLKLQRLFLNVKLQSEHNRSIRTFTILEVMFHNIWDYRLKTLSNGSIKMIDSDGFQHEEDSPIEFSRVVLPENRIAEIGLSWPELTLEDHAKTKGWLWFDRLPEGVFPYRFVFQFSVFDPGNTSGWVKDEETLEFIIEGYNTRPIEHNFA